MRVTPTPKRIAELQSQLGDTRALFFDIDGTIFVKQLLIELMLACGRRFGSKREIVAPLREALRRYRSERTYDYTPVIDAAVAAVPSFFVGLSQTAVRKVARDIVRRMGGETYIFPRIVLIHQAAIPLKERGPIVAITGAPQEIAEIFCQRLGFDLVYGVRYEVVNGRYTGVRDDRTVHDKGAVVDEVAGALKVSLSASVAFGDTVSDLSMFKRVGRSFAVNPHMRLLEAIPQVSSDTRVIVWVNDRQKNGVSFFVWGHDVGRFYQVGQYMAIPKFLEIGVLPGFPIDA